MGGAKCSAFKPGDEIVTAPNRHMCKSDVGNRGASHSKMPRLLCDTADL